MEIKITDNFKLKKVYEDALFFDILNLKVVNEGTEKEREEWKPIAYGVPFENCMKKIVEYELNKKEGSYSIKEFLQLKKELVDTLFKEFI